MTFARPFLWCSIGHVLPFARVVAFDGLCLSLLALFFFPVWSMPVVRLCFFLFSAQVAYLPISLSIVSAFDVCPIFRPVLFSFRRALPFYPYSFGINIAQPPDV